MEASKLIKVPVDDLRIGMYVDQLDRPWTETRFMYQGFFIQNQETLQELARVSRYVFVDAERNVAENKTQPAKSIERYPVTQTVEREITVAKAIHREATVAAKTIFTQMLQSGRLDVDLARETVNPMLDSMMRNPNALIWLTRMKQHDSYIFSHALNTSIWGLAFARHLGMEKDEIYEVGLGCLLMDVGKTQLPLTLLLKPGPLDEKEWKLARSHVDLAGGIIRGMDGMTPRVMELVQSHHERFDGSGYPDKLKGHAIPVFAKIAGIVDTYDALVSFRPYAGERPPHEAMRYIYGLRGTLFQDEVVVKFMQVVGAFPTGSVVELNTGAVGVVLAQNPQRLRPRLALVTDEAKRRMSTPAVVDMMYDSPWSDTGKFWIDRCLQNGAYGIEPQQLGI
ncbi:MAG TPA: HD domain-containing phosphohydrolase [Gammaproteobacteria bacterium]|jgi:HD-GYP domain-containing protein (c-di-GMP phosphodiesterase class II)|nr:HD domain-containing phosphohydrolase [Gammaproteobacteria bacterium]